MLYLVEGHPTIEVGGRVDAGEGPGPTIAKIVERFRRQAFTATQHGVRLL